MLDNSAILVRYYHSFDHGFELFERTASLHTKLADIVNNHRSIDRSWCHTLHGDALEHSSTSLGNATAISRVTSYGNFDAISLREPTSVAGGSLTLITHTHHCWKTAELIRMPFLSFEALANVMMARRLDFDDGNRKISIYGGISPKISSHAGLHPYLFLTWLNWAAVFHPSLFMPIG